DSRSVRRCLSWQPASGPRPMPSNRPTLHDLMLLALMLNRAVGCLLQPSWGARILWTPEDRWTYGLRVIMKTAHLRLRVLHLGGVLTVLLVTFPAALAVVLAQAPRQVAVVSFGLFGGQDVFRSEATGAAQIVASRFGGDPVVVRFNARKKADAT